jgi:hypothetical protein
MSAAERSRRTIHYLFIQIGLLKKGFTRRRHGSVTLYGEHHSKFDLHLFSSITAYFATLYHNDSVDHIVDFFRESVLLSLLFCSFTFLLVLSASVAQGVLVLVSASHCSACWDADDGVIDTMAAKGHTDGANCGATMLLYC